MVLIYTMKFLLTQLNEFIFSINTLVFNRILELIFHQTMIFNIVLSEEDINKLVHILTTNQQKKKGSTCHIYSLPYQFYNFFNMNLQSLIIYGSYM
jgi:hypothetical protein